MEEGEAAEDGGAENPLTSDLVEVVAALGATATFERGALTTFEERVGAGGIDSREGLLTLCANESLMDGVLKQVFPDGTQPLVAGLLRVGFTTALKVRARAAPRWWSSGLTLEREGRVPAHARGRGARELNRRALPLRLTPARLPRRGRRI